MIASSEEANTAVLRASLWRTASAEATPSTNSPIREPSASVSTSRSGSGSRSSRANSSITATHSPDARIGNASAPRRPTVRAASARVNLSESSTFVNQAGRPLSQTAPGRPKPRPMTSWRVACSNSGASKPGRIHVDVTRSAELPRTSQRWPTSQPIGSAIAASSAGPADSSESASASTRATPYWTASRAVSRSRSERSRAMPTARPLTRPTAARRMSWSLEPNSSVVRPSGIATANAKRATMAVWLGLAPNAATTGPISSSSTSTVSLPTARSTAATAQTAISESRNTPRPSRTPPVWVCEPKPPSDYFRGSASPIYKGGNARF